MIKAYEYDKNIKLDRSVACIGYFDGVHKGHQLLINKTVELAKKKNVKAHLITFNPDPDQVINSFKTKQINTFSKRLKLYASLGIEGVIVIPFDEKMMKMPHKDFCVKVLKRLNIDTLICGEDFSFGYKGLGKPKDLKNNGFDVEIVKPLNYYGKKISSTRIKEAIKKGNIKFANRMLGYEFKK